VVEACGDERRRSEGAKAIGTAKNRSAAEGWRTWEKRPAFEQELVPRAKTTRRVAEHHERG